MCSLYFLLLLYSPLCLHVTFITMPISSSLLSYSQTSNQHLLTLLMYPCPARLSNSPDTLLPTILLPTLLQLTPLSLLQVPCFATDVERRSMLSASKVAGLNCLKLMSDTTATALTYGLLFISY